MAAGVPARLLAAYRELIGPLVATRALGGDLFALFFQPSEDDGLPDDEWFTYLATAGLGERTGYELLMRVKGRRPVDALAALAGALAESAAGRQLAPGQIVELGGVAPFARMSAALVTDWVPGEPEWLPGRVRVLQLQPLLPTEVSGARQLGEVATMQQLMRAGVDATDPERAEVALAPLDVNAIWADVEAWLGANAPRAARELRAGADAATLQKLEAALGRALPADYRASLARHDGRAALSDQEYLSCDAVSKRAHAMNQVAGFPPGWIPFASDSGGNLLCIDERDRVSAWEGGAAGLVAASFAAWLERYRDDLLAGGVYGPDADGIMTRL